MGVVVAYWTPHWRRFVMGSFRDMTATLISRISLQLGNAV